MVMGASLLPKLVMVCGLPSSRTRNFYGDGDAAFLGLLTLLLRGSLRLRCGGGGRRWRTALGTFGRLRESGYGGNSDGGEADGEFTRERANRDVHSYPLVMDARSGYG